MGATVRGLGLFGILRRLCVSGIVIARISGLVRRGLFWEGGGLWGFGSRMWVD